MRSNDNQKIIVVGIPKTVDDAQLSELFSEFGGVAEAKVVIDAASKMSRGFGFVTFTAVSAMRAAIKGMNKKLVQGRTLNVRQLVPKADFQSQKKNVSDASQRPCWLLRKGKCTKGANCPFSHTIEDGEYGNCFEFMQSGGCKHGDKCKFSHSSKKDNGNESNEDKEAKVEDKRVCYSFQNGRCHRGKNCMFAHKLLVDERKKENAKEKKQSSETSDVGTKRRRTQSGDRVADEMMKKEELIVNKMAAHENGFVANQKQQQLRQEKQQTARFKKFQWMAKVQGTEKWQQDRMQVQEKRDKEQQEVELHPIKKIKKEKIDMGAAFDDVSNDESFFTRDGKKKKVDKENMRVNCRSTKLDRHLKRTAKKMALTKLLTKSEVEL